MVKMKAGAGGCVGKYNIMCKYLPEDDNCVYNQQETSHRHQPCPPHSSVLTPNISNKYIRAGNEPSRSFKYNYIKKPIKTLF